MLTLVEAAGAYCAQRDRIVELNRQLDELPCCTADPDTIGADSCARRPFGTSPEDAAHWWQLTMEQLQAEGVCQNCLARMPLYRERHKLKMTLSGLMSSMRAAYRRQPAGQDMQKAGRG